MAYLLNVGDLQAGSKAAVCVAGYPIGDDQNKTPYQPNKIQDWINGCWDDALKRVKKIVKGERLVMAILGDSIDNDRHHNTRTTFGTPTEQRGMAVERLMPYANMADAMVAVGGTESHAGGEGEYDEGVAQLLGATMTQHRLLDIDDHLFDIAHHCKLPKDPDQHTAALVRQARMIARRRLDRGLRPADMVIRADQHRFAVGEWHYTYHQQQSKITMLVNPAWQLRTPFMARNEPAELYTVGLTLVNCKTLQIIPIIYEAKDDPIEKIRFTSLDY